MVAEAAVVEQHARDDERARKWPATGLVGTGDKPPAELAVEPQEPLTGALRSHPPRIAPGTAPTCGRFSFGADISRGQHTIHLLAVQNGHPAAAVAVDAGLVADDGRTVGDAEEVVRPGPVWRADPGRAPNGPAELSGRAAHVFAAASAASCSAVPQAVATNMVAARMARSRSLSSGAARGREPSCRPCREGNRASRGGRRRSHPPRSCRSSANAAGTCARRRRRTSSCAP